MFQIRLVAAVLAFLVLPGFSRGQEISPSSRVRKPLSRQNWTQLREGDLVFIRSRSENAPLIAKLSNLEVIAEADDVFTHCGIVFRDGDTLRVYEGAGRGTNRFLSLEDWQKAESNGDPIRRVYVARWAGEPRLSDEAFGRLRNKARTLHNTRYDKGFSWSDDFAYCSELVWKAFAAAELPFGSLPTLGDYVNGVPTEVQLQIKAKLDQPEIKRVYRNGEGYRAEESAISPEDIYKSSKLIPISDESETASEKGGARPLTGVVHGRITSPELSGAVMVANRLLTVADDPADESNDEKKFHMVGLLGDAAARLKQGAEIEPAKTEQIYRALLEKLESEDDEFIADLEDAAVWPSGELSLISSHSFSNKNKLPQKRKRLIRLKIDSVSGTIEQGTINKRPLFKPFPGALEGVIKQEKPEESTELEALLNIEGMASAGGNDLLLGLRSPLKDSMAVILRVKDADRLFSESGPAHSVTVEALLDLGGMGIRGMHRDRAGQYWLIAGLSSDEPQTEGEKNAQWSIWSWDGKGNPKKRFSKMDLPENARLPNPEAICFVGSERDESLLLISDNDKRKPSDFILVPIDSLP